MSRQLVITLPGKDLEVVSPNDPEAGYRAMAEDIEREREAEEWAEAAPSDALP